MNKSAVNGKPGKALEESHLKFLRELSHITGNRHCFDCGQRGPTYVNVTIGSFVCMSCSGLLRGLTPPHRVKSISMASFTPDEIELLKSRGNEYCRKVWLATCTSRDSHVGSEKDPDRLNALRTFMSAKYEQKRFYVDPSKLPQSELNEIQAQTAKALSSSSSSISNSSGSTMQKSPSLSSASSASSLSLHNQNNPSPVLNNTRNSQINSQNRLVNSITLPDIKPLSSLLGPVNVSSSVTSSNQTNGSKSNNLVAGYAANGKPTSTPVPINFINNLSTSQQQNQNKSAVNGTSMCHNDPWEGDNNNFNANFADFDAFNSNSKNGGENDVNDLNSSSNFANFDAFQQPLLPANSSSTVMDLQTAKNGPAPSSSGTAEDKYAALKDLDNIFKQGFNGEGTTNHGISSSVSFPTNLSSSSAGAAAAWFSSSPNQQQGTNPASGSVHSGWSVNGGANGPNPHNPFFNNVAASPWQSTTQGASNSIFSTSPGGYFQTHQAAGGLSHQISNGCSNQTGATNGITSNGFFNGSNNGGFSSQLPSSSFNKAANPFFSAMPNSSANPNNPFL